MKEKVIISVLCSILIIIGILNVSCGPVKKQSEVTGKNNRIVSEERYKVISDENDTYSFQAVNENEPEDEDITLKLHALSACMIDAGTGRILFGKNHNDTRAMASTTKILTCLIALERCSLDDIVTVSEYAASMPDVQLNMTAGEQFRLYDLLLSLMLESHNDTAVAIAEHVGGSVEAFCQLMTERARAIGCNNSVFLTPNGLDKKIETSDGMQQHSTTAQELALIMRECLKNEQFVSICRTQSAMISNIAKNRTYQLSNHNTLLSTMSGAIAGKTGFTCDAGYCYVGAVERNNNVFICALLGCGWPNNKNYKWKDMNTLIDFADKEFFEIKFQDIPINSKLYSEIPVENGVYERKALYNIGLETEKTESDEDTFVMRDTEEVIVLYEIPESVSAPINKGEIVGRIYFIVNGQTLKCENLTAIYDVDKLMYSDMFIQVYNCYCRKNQSSSPFSKDSEK